MCTLLGFFFFVTIIYWPRHLVYHKSDNKTFIRNRKENHNIFLLFLGPVIFLQFKRGPVIGKLENMFNTKHSPVSCKLSRTWVQEFKIYFSVSTKSLRPPLPNCIQTLKTDVIYQS